MTVHRAKALALGASNTAAVAAAAVERRAPVWGYAIRQTTKAVQGWHGWETSGILTEGQRLHLERPVSERAALRMVRWAQAGWIERDTRGRPSYGNRVPELATLAARCGLSDWYQQMGWPWCAFGVHVAALAEGSRTARLGLGGAYNALSRLGPEARTREIGRAHV